MPEIDWAYVANEADKVARSIAVNWVIVEKDDVKQSILLHAYENRKYIEANNNEAFIYSFCKKAGMQFVSAERDKRDVEDGQFYYTPDEARAALKTFVLSDEEIGQRVGSFDDLLMCRITDSLMSARMDATIALARLPKDQQALIMRIYVMGLPAADDTQRKASNRAVDALARQMNRDLRKASV